MKRNRFDSSRFSILNRFIWILRFSKCFCLRIRDRLADSRFDIIRLRFRSSVTEFVRFGSSESDLVLAWFWFSSSEPELELTGFVCLKAEKISGHSHGGKPPSKAENGFPSKGSEGKVEAGRVDNMATE
ncbi:BZIP transcription factor [Quillaja saponaria]|uniref:BZIP transcription factor n=1 Tax=Quillaja saponaria TaxID=32244 RepID=A0AAD7PF20_QUISA|nr:BZIP transcription factor [Quillaja saponaria]